MPLTKPGAGELNRLVHLVRHISIPAEESSISGGAPVLQDLGHEVQTIKGKLEAVGALTYWGAVQVGGSVTHRLYMREIKGVTDVRSLTQVVEMHIDGETYKLVRAQELDGAPRFVCCDVTCEGKTSDQLQTTVEGIDPLA